MSETVTQLLDRYDDDLMELARLSTQGMFDKDLYASASEARQQIVDLVAAARREVETVNEEAERQAGVICNLNTDLATSRAALEDVRRVEAWMEDYPDGRYVDVSRGWFCMVDVRRGDDEDVPAESIAALGRALAQEAGDGR